MKKYSKGMGWYNDSERHRLARLGIKTGKAVSSLSRIDYVKKVDNFVNDYKDMIDNETMKDFLKKIGFDYDDIKNVNEDESGIIRVEIGSQEWYIFDDDDRAEEFAKDRVRQDLEDEPEMFTQDWLQNHIDIDRLRNDLQSDVEEINRSYYDDIESENSTTQENRLIEELIDGTYLDEDEYTEIQDKIDEKESRTTELALKKVNTPEEKKEWDKLDEEIKPLERKKEELVDTAKEDAVEERTEEELKDPMEYLRGIYPEDEVIKKAIDIGGIDIEDATDDAISTDGWQHFVSSYDGNSDELLDGKVIVRIN